MANITNTRTLVAVVDDDTSVRESLPDLIKDFGYAVEAFQSAEDFLAHSSTDPSCLILDIALPGMSGPDLQRVLQRRGRAIPIIFITARDEESIRARLLDSGAVAVLFKPFTAGALEEALDVALETD